jgi:hypothetical protein
MPEEKTTAEQLASGLDCGHASLAFDDLLIGVSSSGIAQCKFDSLNISRSIQLFIEASS